MNRQVNLREDPLDRFLHEAQVGVDLRLRQGNNRFLVLLEKVFQVEVERQLQHTEDVRRGSRALAPSHVVAERAGRVVDVRADRTVRDRREAVFPEVLVTEDDAHRLGVFQGHPERVKRVANGCHAEPSTHTSIIGRAGPSPGPARRMVEPLVLVSERVGAGRLRRLALAGLDRVADLRPAGRLRRDVGLDAPADHAFERDIFAVFEVAAEQRAE